MRCKILKFLLIFLTLCEMTIKNCATYSLHTAAGCFSKKDTVSFMNLTSVDNLALRGDGSKCGEDDFKITELKHLNFLVVADGVGGWNLQVPPINPKYFVSEFMNVLTAKYHALSHEHIKSHDDERNSILYQIVSESIQMLNRRTENINRGSATIMALSLNLKTLLLNSYQVGDAGYMIVRDSKIIYRSVDQLKGFNFPFQLGIGPEMDQPLTGITNQLNLKLEDVILIGSDGLFDNLFDKKILAFINFEMSKVVSTNSSTYSTAAMNIAKKLTVLAKKLGERTQDVWTPFGLEIAMEMNMYYSGGKNDDTTVVAAIIAGV